MSPRRLILTVLLSLVTVPAFAFAAFDASKGIVPCSGVNCTCHDLATLANNVLNWIIYLCVFGSALLFAYAGGKYLTAGGDVSTTKEASGLLKNAAKGLIIVLMAWVIVSTILNVLATDQVKQTWNTITGC